MTTRAIGTFEVKLNPQTPEEGVGDPSISRMSLDKAFHGDLEGAGKGQMLATSPGAGGSGVYVAIERVTGTLLGRQGSFVLHHRGIMTRGVPQLEINVSPDSGTGDLVGLEGKFTIKIDGGKHSYEFEYSLAEAG